MVDSRTVNDIIVKGINRFVVPYGQPAERIQIVFKLDQSQELQFILCVAQQPKNTVTLEQLIGRNLYNFAVKKHIKNLLLKFAAENECDNSEIDLLAGVKERKACFWLRKNKEIIRPIIDMEELK